MGAGGRQGYIVIVGGVDHDDRLVGHRIDLARARGQVLRGRHSHPPPDPLAPTFGRPEIGNDGRQDTNGRCQPREAQQAIFEKASTADGSILRPVFYRFD